MTELTRTADGEPIQNVRAVGGTPGTPSGPVQSVQGVVGGEPVHVTSSITMPVVTREQPRTSGGYTAHRVQSSASVNATSVKGSVGQIYVIALTNTAGTAAYIKFYNKVSAPVVGTDVPIATFLVPQNNFINMQFPAGKAFALGIAYAITAAPGDTDTTPVAANQITGSLEYA